MGLNKPAIVAIVGFCVLLLSLLCSTLIFPKLENYLISKETSLTEGSKAFASWKKIPFPFKFKIYFFNVTNPGDVQNGLHPIFKEIGPYVYDEFRDRKILSINEDNDTIRYVQKKLYRFNEEESGCRNQDDIVTILNIGVVNTVNKINVMAPVALPLVNDALPFLYPGIKNIFITKPVRTILFDGIRMSCESEEVDMICEGLRSKMPPTVRLADNNRDYLIAMFHHVNGTEDGPYEIERGLKDTSKGKIISFKDKHILSEWGGDYCNKIRGTDLTVNANLEKIPKKIDFFASDFCRSFSVEFHEETEYLGLRCYSFKNTKLLQDGDCYCKKDSDGGDEGELPICPPIGTMNLGPCIESPIIISQPHFLGAKKSLLQYTEGLKPDNTKHGTIITIEPKTGLALIVKTRFQMNIFLEKLDAIDLLQNVTGGLFPLFWLEEGAEVPSYIIDEIRSNFNKLKIFDVIKYLLSVLGMILLGTSLILAMIKDKVICFNRRNRQVAGQNVIPVDAKNLQLFRP